MTDRRRQFALINVYRVKENKRQTIAMFECNYNIVQWKKTRCISLFATAPCTYNVPISERMSLKWDIIAM